MFGKNVLYYTSKIKFIVLINVNIQILYNYNRHNATYA